MINPLGFIICAALAGFAVYMYRRSKNYKGPAILFSSVSNFPEAHEKSSKQKWPRVLYLASLLFFLLAALDFYEKKPLATLSEAKENSTEGRVIFLALDRSGSMAQKVSDISSSRVQTLSKMDLLKTAAIKLVKERRGDLIALSAFARQTDILVPPTQDIDEVIRKIASLEPVSDKADDGTAIGYAIYKTANLLASLKEQTEALGKDAPYQIEGEAIILATDGLQDPNPLDKENPYRSMPLDDAAAYAASRGIRLYIVNIEPGFLEARFLPNINQMKKVAAATQGKFYHLKAPEDLGQVFEDIAAIEKSRIKSYSAAHYEVIHYYPWFIAAALASLFAGSFFDLVYLKKVPW